MTRPEDVTDAMVTGAHLALYESSAHELDATDDELRAAIAAAINASGCVLVPREPTEAMQRAGGHVNSEWLNDDAPIGEETTYTAPMRGIWKAMLAASAPREQALDRMAENAQELGLYDEGKEKGDE